jgi:hypothetical protein
MRCSSAQPVHELVHHRSHTGLPVHFVDGFRSAHTGYRCINHQKKRPTMKTVKVTRGQFQVLQHLGRKEVSTLKKYPKILLESKELLRACKKVIEKIKEIPEHASRRKRLTAYKRVITICQKAVDAVEK